MRITLFIVLLVTIALTGCPGKLSNSNNTNGNSNTAPTFKPPEPLASKDPVDPNFKPCNPYFPLVPGSRLKYTLTYSSGLVADVVVVVNKLDENGHNMFEEQTQIVDRSGGLEIS